jgi:hypothetical protein
MTLLKQENATLKCAAVLAIRVTWNQLRNMKET